MTLRTPPSWLQNGSHPAENDRLTTQALWATTGIINSASLAVTANSPVGMTVLVASGWAAIVGTTQANMGTYVGYNDASVTLTITTADPTNPRIDRVVMTVNDAYYTGSTNNVVLQVVAGTPAGSPSAPATPANSISLATIAVAAGALSISSGNITDTRTLVTTNIPESGDISSVTAGNGLSGGGSSGAVTLTINTAITADLSTAQTLTNKTLTAPIISTISNTGTLTLPTSTDTLIGRNTTDTLTNKTLTAPIINGATIATSTLTSPKVNLGINAQTGTTYTTVLDDNGKLVTLSNAAAIAVTIPLNSSVAYPVGAQINMAQLGAGQVTVSGTGGVTIVSTGATAASPKARAQYSTLTAVQTSTDNWLVMGDIS
jgi:hypothetical protein